MSSTNYTSDIDYHYLFKILIIGDSGVGKTSLLQRFAHNYFSAEYLATIGVDFQIRTIDIDDKRCKLQVWDTAGQDRFKSVVKSFYRGAHGVIICFDITDFQSFRGVDNWFQEVSKFCQEETPVYLVGTKADLESQRTVPNSTIQAYADQKNLSYIETSSKTSENIDTCFTNFARELVQHSEQLHPPKKDNQKDTNTIIPDDTKPVETKSRCLGGEKCTI